MCAPEPQAKATAQPELRANSATKLATNPHGEDQKCEKWQQNFEKKMKKKN